MGHRPTVERKQELKGGPHDVFSLRQLSNGQLPSDSATLLSDYGTPDKGECQKVLKGHTNDVISLVVLLNVQLVFGSYNHRIKLWDIDTCEFKEILKGHTGFVWSLVLLWEGQLTSDIEIQLICNAPKKHDMNDRHGTPERL